MKQSALLALLLAAFAAQAQTAKTPRAPAEPVAAEAEQLAWTALRGSAIDMAVGADGAAFTLDREGQVWMRRSGGNTSWLRLPGHFVRIDAASERLAWAVDREGGIFRYNGTYWRPVENTKAMDVGVSAGGVAFAVLADGTLARYDARRDTFVTVDDAPRSLSRVDVDDKDQPWVVLANGSAQRYDGRAWIKLAGQISDLAVGPEGAAFAISPEQRPLRWNPASNRWTLLAGRASVIAIGPDGNPWLATPDGDIFAQQPDPRPRGARAEGPAQVFTQVLNWRKVRGAAKSIGISAKGQVVALGPNGEIWQWKGRDWSRMAGKLAQVAVAPDGRPWGIDDDGKLLQYQGSYWRDLPGSASDIAIGSTGAVWIVQPDGSLAQWQAEKREWQTLADDSKVPPKARRVAVDPEGRPWIISTTGAVQRHDGKRWTDYPAIDATEIAIGPEGSVFIVADSKPWRYDRLNKRWERLTGEAMAIAVGPKGQPWAVTAQNDIYATSYFEDERPASILASGTGGGTRTSTTNGAVSTTAESVAPPVVLKAVATSKEPINLGSFLQIRNVAAKDIAIGNDGSVFALAFDGALIRWNNTQNKFISFPGTFSRIAVAPDGKPWGVTTRNEVWRHDGTTWRVIYNITAQDIAIGYDGTVIVAAPDEVLYKYNAVENRFVRMLAAREGDPAPLGSRLAVDPSGKPWTIDKNNRLRRCDRTPCELLAQSARDIEIGPEGSVFITDMDRKLRRFNPATGEWEFVGIDAEVVAVGPTGKPWIVNGKSEVWYSALFKRDESKDITTAATSSTTTATAASTTSTVPVFTFTVNMAFDVIPLPAGFTQNSYPYSVAMAFAPDGKLVMADSSMPSPTFWNYNESTKAWVQDTSVPSASAVLGGFPVSNLTISKDGTYWLTTGKINPPDPTRVVRRKASPWVIQTELPDCSTTPGCTMDSPMSIGAGADGSIYATSTGDNLYRFDATTLKFVKVTSPPRPPNGVAFVDVAPNGRPWVASIPGPANPTSPTLYEYDGTNWVSRNDAALPNPVYGTPGACEGPFGTPLRCVSIGGNGSVYALGAANKMVRWNPTNRAWDLITSSPILCDQSTFAAAPDGRLWVWTGECSPFYGSPPPGFQTGKLYRSR